MSILECRLAAEKPMDGKPFTVCEVGTWFYVEVGMLKKKCEDEGSDKQLKECAADLFDAFGTGKDKTERGATLEELKVLPSNGSIAIIPKTKDDFIKVEDWSCVK